ncbi:hypothetical protein GGX14DRAFT_395293 [Mycena pura]|uniref:Uncharacterized protein n=1 Tax=Mycena pura TaxID=153505 RepID=A0AAD6VGR2_9AGAR|nr:hypothetical protein GGX14DRAFT_395293 [Mycena pura]
MTNLRPEQECQWRRGTDKPLGGPGSVEEHVKDPMPNIGAPDKRAWAPDKRAWACRNHASPKRMPMPDHARLRGGMPVWHAEFLTLQPFWNPADATQFFFTKNPSAAARKLPMHLQLLPMAIDDTEDCGIRRAWCRPKPKHSEDGGRGQEGVWAAMDDEIQPEDEIEHRGEGSLSLLLVSWYRYSSQLKRLQWFYPGVVATEVTIQALPRRSWASELKDDEKKYTQGQGSGTPLASGIKSAVSLMPVIAQASNFDPLVFLRVFAPRMGGFVDYNKFDLRADTDTDWIPMNETGSAATENLYLPFFDFTADPFAPATTKAGYRLDEDETSEVVYIANPAYISPTMNVTAGRITSDIESTINTVTALTYLPDTAAAVSKRDIWSNGTFVALPFTSQTAFVGKFENLGSKICEESWNLTATVVTADGTTTFFSAIDNLSVTVPPNTSSTITFHNSVDPGFTAVMTFEAATPFLVSQGSSARIGSNDLTQEAQILFCVND